jgi:hypothetical protein
MTLTQAVATARQRVQKGRAAARTALIDDCIEDSAHSFLLGGRGRPCRVIGRARAPAGICIARLEASAKARMDAHGCARFAS